MATQPGPLRTLAIFMAHSGDSWFWGIGLTVIWWIGNPEWKHRALVLLVGILGTAFIVQILKFSFRRRRPEGDWGKIYRKTDPHSFPSGHSARAGLLLGLGFWLGPSWFTLTLVIYSPLMALARIVMGVHYSLDVVAGYVIGLLIGAAGGWIITVGS